MILPRRLALAAPALLLAAAGPPSAQVGEAVEVVGSARADGATGSRRLAPAASLAQGDTLVTGTASLLRARLRGEIDLRLGAEARLRLDSLGAGGTTLRRSAGPFWFSRPATAPRSPVAVVSPAALIAVRGTAFWGGETAEGFSVFVARGAAEVSAQGQLVVLTAGQGTDVPPGAAPEAPVAWAASRIAAALAAVGLTP